MGIQEKAQIQIKNILAGVDDDDGSDDDDEDESDKSDWIYNIFRNIYYIIKI